MSHNSRRGEDSVAQYDLMNSGYQKVLERKNISMWPTDCFVIFYLFNYLKNNFESFWDEELWGERQDGVKRVQEEIAGIGGHKGSGVETSQWKLPGIYEDQHLSHGEYILK